MKRIVVCMKWGTLFDATYVNVLFSAVKAHLESMDEFVCFTDDQSGLHPDIKAQPIPAMPIDSSFYAAGAWPKLGIFKKGALPDNSRVLFIDLDMMITGDLERLFALPQAFIAIGGTTWNAPPKRKHPKWYLTYKAGRQRDKNIKATLRKKSLGLGDQTVPPNTMGSGIFIFDGDTLDSVYDAFASSPTKARALYTNEQHFLEHHLEKWHPWPAGWVIHYKYNLRQPLGWDLIRHPTPPPADCSVLAFSGRPRPHELATKWMSSLSEFPHIRLGRVNWFRRYWQYHQSETNR